MGQGLSRDGVWPRGGSESRLPGEARAIELVRTVSGQEREMEASRVEDQGGHINHAAARQGRSGDISSGLLPGMATPASVGTPLTRDTSDMGTWTVSHRAHL